ncbi:MAG: hypothetical protein Q9202_006810 [Teloschistes flavicans]
MSVVPWQKTSKKPIHVPQEGSMIRPSLSLVPIRTTETGALVAKPSYTISGKYPHGTDRVSIPPHKRKNYTRIVKDFEPLVWEVLDQGLPIVEGDRTDAELDKVAAKSSSKWLNALMGPIQQANFSQKELITHAEDLGKLRHLIDKQNRLVRRFTLLYTPPNSYIRAMQPASFEHLSVKAMWLEYAFRRVSYEKYLEEARSLGVKTV